MDEPLTRADPVVVQPPGDVDLHSAAWLRDALTRACAQPRLVIVDLRDVAFLSSVGVGLLARAREQVEAGGGRLVVRRASDAAARVIRLSGAADLIA